MLTPADERFTHQVALPHAVVASSDPGWRERYWFSFQDVAGTDTVLTCGFGQYPNNDVQEGFAIVGSAGTQWNVRMSRTLSPDRDHVQVGPFSVEVREPFHRLGVAMGPNPSGVEFEIEFQSTFEAGLEDRHFEVRRGRVVHDLVRYVQLGRGEGWLRAGGVEHDINPERWWGVRDHSWGVRPTPRTQGAPPPAPPDWGFMMFLPLQFETFSVYCYLFERADGSPLYLDGMVMNRAGAPAGPTVTAVDHDLEWDSPAALTMRGGTVVLTLSNGERLSLELEALPGRAFLRGGGYGGMDDWYQGHWRGDESLDHEVWDLTDPQQLKSNARGSSDHLVRATGAAGVGFGIIEYMVLRGYERYRPERAEA